MTKAQIIFTHRRLTESVTMEVETDLLTRALREHDVLARRQLAQMMKVQYSREHGRVWGFLTRDGLGICETEESLLRRDPQADTSEFSLWARVARQLGTPPAS